MVDENNLDAAGRLILSAQPLGEGDLAQAYVLVGLCHDTVSLERWRRLAASGEQPTPLVWQAIRDPRGYIHALFAHRIEHDLVDGATLVATDILTAGPAWRTAMETVELSIRRIACQAGCPSIRILVHPDRKAPTPEQLRAVFLGCGYSDRGPYLSRSSPQAVSDRPSGPELPCLP